MLVVMVVIKLNMMLLWVRFSDFLELNFSVKLYQNQAYISFSSLRKGNSALCCLFNASERKYFFQRAVSSTGQYLQARCSSLLPHLLFPYCL